ncbi:hypothetical protein TNCV_4324741 [Trichonephila clavipes]|nr:hypothetical protein TNCV_4324741 [Trichonephila clavipes]
MVVHRTSTLLVRGSNTGLGFEPPAMIPPAHKAHQTVSFSGCYGVSTYTCELASLQMRQFCLLTFGPIRRIYALLDDRFDELPNQTENKSLDSC